MTTLLLLIDLQRAFCDADGSMARQGRSIDAMSEAARSCGRLAESARAAGIPVAWTRMAFRPDYADGGRLINDLRPNLKRIGALRAGTADVELSGAAGAAPSDIVVDKTRYSAMIGTQLDSLLAARGITRIIVGGVTTSMCVESTVRDLSQRDYEVLVVRDACGDFSAERHAASLAALEFGFAAVIPSGEAMALLTSGARCA